MNKQEKTALNMTKFIQAQTLLQLEKLNELNLDEIADYCERLHELSEQLHEDLRKEVDREKQETVE
uniref:Rop family plasmid primer RNA-binding protein n=1 Tax=Rahnella sp. WMR114 TaxID=657335 RepID=UPI0001C4B2CA|nr:Rop family plasmid primer RNA-binding protein [Rahnella sp. WMR114]CAZ68143.1 ROM protein [Rahnella sp. WMR114]